MNRLGISIMVGNTAAWLSPTTATPPLRLAAVVLAGVALLFTDVIELTKDRLWFDLPLPLHACLGD